MREARFDSEACAAVAAKSSDEPCSRKCFSETNHPPTLRIDKNIPLVKAFEEFVNMVANPFFFLLRLMNGSETF